MYLKRIEMAGFKSFPEKIRLEFKKGITAVVGPNGSGKSNISDAVRWVLGEQSAKNLRGAKMEDVIFAGTANRRPLGFAEVSLVIDNTDKALSMDFSEITVTRRVFRSGESEYKLNGTGCRLKDIHELFMDTGIGREGYSIIGQGRIEEILSSKGEDRRLLFEEAAGIVKFKSRRYEAIHKLEKEKQNIVRVNDIIDELEGQLEPLSQQSEKAKQYLKFMEDLKLIQVNIFVSEVSGSAEKLKKLEGDLDNIKSQIQSAKDSRSLLDAETEKLRMDIELADKAMEAVNGVLAELRSQTEQCENDIVLRQEQKQHILSDIQFLKDDIEKKETAITNNSSLLQHTEIEWQSVSTLLDQKNALLDEKNQAFSAFTEKMSISEKQIEEYNAQIFDSIRNANEIKTSAQQVISIYNQLEERKEQLESEKNRNSMLTETKISEISACTEKLDIVNRSFASAVQSLVTLGDEKAQLKITETALADKTALVNRHLRDTLSRIKLLSELEKNYEGYYKSVKNILQHKKNNPAALPGVVGAVGELLSVPEVYETAIEVALGQAVQNIVANTETDAKEAIDYLKKTKSGRATFLPVSAVTGRSLGGNKEQLLADTGVLGVAEDLISYETAYKNIFSSLLGRVIIVDTMDNAIAFSKKHKYSYKVVTLEGELISAGGAITGGSMAQKSTGIFTRTREIKELRRNANAYVKEEKQLNEDLASIRRQLSAIRAQEDENKRQRQSCEVEIAALNQKLTQLNAEHDRLKTKLADMLLEDEQLMEQIIAANKEIRQYEMMEAEAEKETELAKARLNAFQASIATYRQQKEEMTHDITELRVEIVALTEKRKALNDNKARINKEITDYRELIHAHTVDIEKKHTQLDEKSSDIVHLDAQIKEIQQSQAEAQNNLALEAEKKQELHSRVAVIETTVQENMELMTDLKNEQVRFEVKKEHIESETSKLYDQMWEEYEITYQLALTYTRLEKSLSKLQSEERAIKNKIKALGNVNVGAIEEYKLLKERYEFLFKQRADIEAAEEKLKDIIMELTKLMEEQFLAQFKIISDNFTAVFSEMFGGGKAQLKLADEGNLLESGIDIIAQPPGKNLQSLSLLSGGERALTATALLFAILRMKPSPFCILDEIEAALDDANVARYANYLKNFCDDTQFILITHRKGVMEAADVLYGITMQEQGVSKLISVKFEDENETA